MKCQGCGHDYPSTLTRCTVCGTLTPRRSRTFSDSRLIEFPRQARVNADRHSAEPSLPAWRVELNERVRQIRAKRNGPGRTEPVIGTTGPASKADRTAPTAGRDSNPLVEAALNRVRRASRDATGISGRQMVSQASAGCSLPLDKDSTARALEPQDAAPMVEVRQAAPETQHQRHAAAEPEFRPLRSTPASVSTPAAASMTSAPAFSPATTASASSTNSARRAPEIDYPAIEEAATVEPHTYPDSFDEPIEELDPLDYLEAEVRKVDQALSRDLHPSTSAPVLGHIVGTALDLAVMALSTMPFVALVGAANGFLFERSIVPSAIISAGLVSFLYLSITHCLCGKTFGMMLTGTRVVEVGTNKPLSTSRALLRSLACFAAAAPAGLGLLMALFSRNHRGLHDLLSGTVVVRDF